MDNTKIEWTDATWNPVTGCTEVSPGCDRCYAKSFAERWRGIPGHYFEQGFDVQLRPNKLDQPLRWSKPRRIFVNSMSDLFHDEIPDDFIAQVFAVMGASPHHTFQLLTKRHGRMRALLNSDAFRGEVWQRIAGILQGRGTEQAYVGAHHHQPWPIPHVWVGVSVENQQWADIRIPALLATPAAVRFLSCEPLLGPVDLSRWIDDEHGALDRSEDLDWVIVGGESGHGARPMHPEWARSLRDQCTAAGVAFHFKQWGEWAPHRVDGGVHVNGRISTHRNQYESHRFAPDGTVYVATDPDLYSYPGMASLLRVGKRKAGRELDGRTWDEFPEAVTL